MKTASTRSRTVSSSSCSRATAPACWPPGHRWTIDRDRDKNPVCALREIGDETITADDLKEQLIHSMQKYVEVDEPEAETVPLLSSSPAAAAVAPQSSSDDGAVQFDRMSEEDLLRGLENLAPPTETDEEAE